MIIPNTRSASWAVPGLLKNIVQGDPVENMSATEVLYKICTYFNISEELLLKKTKRRDLVYPRQLGAYIMCRYTNLSLKNIASFLCHSDHTVVINSRERISDLISLPHEQAVRDDIFHILNIGNTIGEMRTDLVGKVLRKNGRLIKVIKLLEDGQYECQDVNRGVLFQVKRSDYDNLYLYRGTTKKAS